MDGSFACPECGSKIQLKGLSPGREVRCEWCSTWVEVPYIPRAEQVRRGSRRRYAGRVWSPLGVWRLSPVWARVSFSLLVIAILITSAVKLTSARIQSAEWDAVERLVRSSQSSEKRGRLDTALLEIEAALVQAKGIQSDPERLEELRRDRDALAVREVESQLSWLNQTGAEAAGDPGQSVGRALTLMARCVRDPALSSLEPSIQAALERHRERWAEADSREASAALSSGDVARSMELTERQFRTAAELAPVPRRRLQEDAATRARTLISRHGALIEPIRGQFTLGSPQSYTTQYRPLLTDALRRKGYLPCPVKPLWEEVWTTLSPYHVVCEITERQDDHYFQSPNRVSLIETRFTITAGDGSTTLWQERPRARTAIPVPGIPAYQASRMAVSDHRSPEFERVLYENARVNLFERVSSQFTHIPPCPASSLGPGG